MDNREIVYGMLAKEFKTDRLWLRHAKRRLVPLELMSDEQKEALVDTINRRMPKNR